MREEQLASALKMSREEQELAEIQAAEEAAQLKLALQLSLVPFAMLRAKVILLHSLRHADRQHKGRPAVTSFQCRYQDRAIQNSERLAAS